MSGAPSQGPTLTPDPDACLEAAGALKSCLLEERAALAGRDPAALEAAISEKARGLRTFAAALGAERASTAEALRNVFHENARGDDRAAERWRAFLTLANECNELNVSNGAAVRLRQRQVENSIALLRGDGSPTETYGPHGTAADGSTGRPLTEA